MDNKKIFFQSSLPRAGSTLLQNIIGQNPDFYVTPTSGVLELVYAARKNYVESPEFKAQDSETMRKAFNGFCYHGIHGFFDSITDKKYVLDKSRGWGYYQRFLNSFYPDPKIICMLRDPVDILTSMEKKFRQGLDTHDDMVNSAELKGITTESRIDIWVGSVPIGLAMERLYQIVKQGDDKNMLFVKFENLTNNPPKEMSRIYNYLEVPEWNHDFTNIEQITHEDDSVYGKYGDHIIKNKLVPSRSDAMTVLGPDVCNWIRNRYSWFYEKFQYR